MAYPASENIEFPKSKLAQLDQGMGTPASDLKGKVAIISGGNGGIGFGMAQALAEAGADIAILGRNTIKNGIALQRLHATGRNAIAVPCDVTSEEAVEQAFARTLETFGRIDCCIANAGGAVGTNTLAHVSTEDWRRVIAVNLDGTFFMFRAAARHMMQRAGANDAGGRLIAVSSTVATYGSWQSPHYAASKSALIGLVKSLAVDLARIGVTTNAILPGWIETGMTAGLFNHPPFRNVMMSRIPAQRFGSPEDLGAIAVYLASDASRFHNGDIMTIDGAYTNLTIEGTMTSY